MRHNMKHSTQCFITRWNISKIKNTVFSVFHLVMKHWASCFIYCLNFTKRLWRQPGQKFLFMFFFFRSKPCMSAVSKAQSHHMTTTVIENKISPGRGLEFWKNPLAFATNIRKKQASDVSVRNLANNQDNNCELIWSRTWSIPKIELCFVLLI